TDITWLLPNSSTRAGRKKQNNYRKALSIRFLYVSLSRNDGTLVIRFPLHGFYFRFQERFCKLSVFVIHLLFSLPSKRVLFILFILSFSL
ncbi:hypothetical protein, partial [uncultured Bacteroides sp.]|uniref:hypothetical protein n=1 Tax=uncultured Bacteroides sp. TaxID=162156 RepID=UPI00267727D3